MIFNRSRHLLTISALPFLFVQFGCGASGSGSDGSGGNSDSGLFSVEITGLRTDASVLNFKFYRADCIGSHPCDTWLAQANISSYTVNTKTYQLRAPADINDLSVQLRIETTETASACIGARATTTTARKGSTYAGTTLSLGLNHDAIGPPFDISMPNACPFSYKALGGGSGIVVLARSGFPDVSDSSKYPDEFAKDTSVTATAMPNGGSKFTKWSTASACASLAQTTCQFLTNDLVKLEPIFELN